MNTYEKRQLYRVVIKLMLLFAVLLFIGLFIRGVFHKNPGAVEMPVESFRLDAIPDRLQVVRWNGQEIAILPRTPAILQRLGSTRENASTAALDADHIQRASRTTAAAVIKYKVINNGLTIIGVQCCRTGVFTCIT